MMEKLTIGIFTDVFYPMTDGVMMVVDNYAKRLAHDFNVIVFAPRYIGKDFDDSIFNYKVVRCMSVKVPFIDYSLPIPKMDSKFQKELKKYHLDLVHIHSPFTIGEAGVKYAKKNNIPVIATMHSQYKQDFLRAVRSEKLAKTLTNQLIKVYNKCDECWAVNKEVARIFYEDYGYKTLPKVMNNATEMEPVRDTKKAIELINEKHHLKDEKVFIFVGRINNLKNVFFIVDALKIVHELKPELKFKMLFIGTGQDEEELKKLIKKNKLNEYVLMVGKVTDRYLLSCYYTRSDLFLFPSLYDASSIVQIEAASGHTPVLFLKGAATTATVTNNVNGFIEENDRKLYAKRIIDILEDKKLYEEVSNNCYRDLYKNWDDTIKEVEKEYLRIIEEKKNDYLEKCKEIVE